MKYHVTKCNYNITFWNADNNGKDARAVPGYVFNYNGFRFGVSRCDGFQTDGEPRVTSTWRVTELFTGLSLGSYCHARTRDDAIERLFCIDLEKIAVAVDRWKEKNTDLNAEILPSWNITKTENNY